MQESYYSAHENNYGAIELRNLEFIKGTREESRYLLEIFDNISIDEDSMARILEDGDMRDHLICAANYAQFLKPIVGTWRRILPQYFHHGKDGLEDVRHYIKKIISDPSNVENETEKFLTGGTSTIDQVLPRTYANKDGGISDSSGGASGLLWYEKHTYRRTTSNKIFSRIHFFDKLGYDKIINEKVSLNSLSHNLYIWVPLALLSLAVVIVLVLSSHGTIIPAITPFIIKCVPKVFSLAAQSTLVLGIPFLVKMLMSATRPIFGNPRRNVVRSKSSNPLGIYTHDRLSSVVTAPKKEESSTRQSIVTDEESSSGTDNENEDTPPPPSSFSNSPPSNSMLFPPKKGKKIKSKAQKIMGESDKIIRMA